MADSARPIVLTAPEAGVNVELHIDPAAVLQVEFDINSAMATRAGNDLVFSFENGGKLILIDFIDIIANGQAPEFVLSDGTVVAGDALYASLGDIPLETAAGASAGGGGSTYIYEPGELLGGFDSLLAQGSGGTVGGTGLQGGGGLGALGGGFGGAGAGGFGGGGLGTGGPLADTTAPDAPVITRLAATSDTGVSNADRLTADITPLLQGTGEPGATVSIYAAGVGLLGTATVNGAGNWSFESPAFADGDIRYYATQADAAGNVSSSSNSLVVTVDTVATVDSVVSADIAGGTVNHAAIADGYDIEIKLDGTAKVGDKIIVTDASGTVHAPYELTAADIAAGKIGTTLNPALNGDGTIQQGDQTITVRVEDAAGNSSEHTLTANFDTVATVDSVVSADIAGGTVNHAAIADGYDIEIKLDGTAKVGDKIIVTDASGTVHAPYELTAADIAAGKIGTTLNPALNGDGTIQQGDQIITVRVEDAAGNSSEHTLTANFDTVATVDSVVSADIAGGTVNHAAIADGYDIEIKLDGTAKVGDKIIVTDASGTVHAPYELTAADIAAGKIGTTLNPALNGDGTIQQGDQTITVRVEDAAGNSSEHTLTANFDTVATVDSVVSADIAGGTVNHAAIADGYDIEIKLDGTAKVGDKIIVTDASGTVHAPYELTAADIAAGKIGTTLNPALNGDGTIQQGDQTITVRVEDAAGNSSEHTLTANFDTVATVDSVVSADIAGGTVNHAAIADGYDIEIKLDGTAKVGDKIIVTDASGTVHAPYELTAADIAAGKIGTTLNPALNGDGTIQQGDQTITVRVEDAAGNSSEHTLTANFDTVSTVDSVVSADIAGGTVNHAALSDGYDIEIKLDGTAKVGDKIIVTDASGTVHAPYELTAADIAAGKIGTTLNPALNGDGTIQQGDQTITVRVEDAAGNSSEHTLTANFDTVATVDSVVSADIAGGTVNHAAIADGYDIEIKLDGTAKVGDKIIVTDASGTVHAPYELTAADIAAGKIGTTLNPALNGDGTIQQGDQTITVRVEDAAGNSSEHTLTANFDTVAPVFTDTSFSINENTTSNVVGTVVATDDAVGNPAGEITYTFANGTGTSDDGFFHLGSAGTLTLTDAGLAARNAGQLLDYESGPRKAVMDVVATDAAGNATNQSVTVHINDVNEAPTVWLNNNLIINGSFEDGVNFGGSNWTKADSLPGWKNESDTSMEPHKGSHMNVGTTDGDNYVDLGGSPGNAHISQTIEGLSDGETYTLQFSMFDKAFKAGNADSGMLEVYWNGHLVATLHGDSASWSEVSLNLVADGTSGTLSFKEVGTSTDNHGIALDNVRLFGTAGADVTVAEHVANGTVVATAAGSDVDAGDTLSFWLLDGEGNRVSTLNGFAINQTTGVVSVVDSNMIDYESATNHAITLKVVSFDGTENSVPQDLTVNIIDVPELVTVDEGSAVILTVADLSVSGESLAGHMLRLDGLPAGGDVQKWDAAADKWISLGNNAKFSYDDLAAGHIRYSHAGGEDSSDVLRFDVLDSTGKVVLVDKASVNVAVNPINDAPVLDLDSTGQVEVIYNNSGASYNNVLGVFTYDANGNPVFEQVILDHTRTDSGVDKGQFGSSLGSFDALEDLHFFILPNGSKSWTGGSATEPNFVFQNGKWVLDVGNAKIPVFFSDQGLNSDNVDHFRIVTENGKLVVRVEDVNGGGDRNYSDVVAEITPSGDADTDTGFAATFVEGKGAVAIVGDVRISDADNTHMKNAVITLKDAVAGDTLSFEGDAPAGITVTIAPDGHSIILSGDALSSAYEQALKQIRYENSGNIASGTTSREIDVAVTDADGASSGTATAVVTVVGVNDVLFTTSHQETQNPNYTNEFATQFDQSGTKVVNGWDVTVGEAGGTDSISVDKWNGVKSVQATSSGDADVSINNFVHVDVNLGSANDSDTEGSSVTIQDAKRGNVTTGNDGDHITIHALTNDKPNTGWSDTFTIHTNDGDDTLDLVGSGLKNQGGSTVFVVDAGSGNDTVNISGENYSLNINGGAGNDTITVSGSAAHSTLAGGDGVDHVTVTGALAHSVVSGEDVDINGSVFNSTLTGEDITIGGALDFSSVSGGDITVGGSVSNSTLSGGTGDDTIRIGGNATNVTLSGGEGSDHITVVGNYSGPAIDGGSGDDFISIAGSTTGAHLVGGIGNDELIAGSGTDTLTGGVGNDTMDGGAGYDTAILQGNFNEYRVTDLGDDGLRFERISDGAVVETDIIKNVENFTFGDKHDLNLTDVLNNAPSDVGMTRATGSASVLSTATLHLDAHLADGAAPSTVHFSGDDMGGVGSWTDTAGIPNNAYAESATYDPHYDASALNGHGGISFANTDLIAAAGINIADRNDINSSLYDSGKSFAVVFETGAVDGSMQVVYDNGSVLGGYNIVIGADNHLYAQIHGVQAFGSEATQIDLGLAQADTTYSVIVDHDKATNTLSVWCNGEDYSDSVAPGIHLFFSSDIGIGGANHGVYAPDHDFVYNDNTFKGSVGEVIQWNESLGNKVDDVQSYLDQKWFASGDSLTVGAHDGMILGSLSAHDADNDPLTYSLSNDGGLVNLVSAGSEHHIVLNTLVDSGMHDIRFDVTATDSHAASHSERFIVDVNDPSGTISLGAADTGHDVTIIGLDKGEKLDLSQLLQDEHRDTLDQYLHFSTETEGGSTNTLITVDVHGGGNFGAGSQQITLVGVDMTSGGHVDSASILNDLLANGKLVTDL
ncbi:Ig-like domain-containing protein [Desulfovibrio subterraneus]|uniref:Ig-like domain-containing protein n=1 Tax=Desulfovibrio subterraneus TaxID=2718620 RepID=UPI0022B88239|nr:Ig-like domain-containing protein [Desulfovibrio subterraneus]WBF69200.1 Ig-like domain-containing protein [Desulfovibrio subterraneus]